MALTLYLAMTCAEIQNCQPLPAHIAWMACHFSPYGSGLSNMPQQLPEGSVLILNDRIPPQGHDPKLVASQLAQTAEKQAAARILLDFQRPGCNETAAVVSEVLQVAPCPTAVTPAYAAQHNCPVFLSPALRQPLQAQLANWDGREVWLEALPECQVITVTEQGSRIVTNPLPGPVVESQLVETLFCRYRREQGDDHISFTVWRDHEMLSQFLTAAEELHVPCAIGLYQQLRQKAAEDI